MVDRVLVGILAYDRLPLLQETVMYVGNSLRKEDELIIGMNANCHDDVREWVQESGHQWCTASGVGISANLNRMLRIRDDRHFLRVDSDLTIWPRDWIGKLHETLESAQNIGSVGAHWNNMPRKQYARRGHLLQGEIQQADRHFGGLACVMFRNTMLSEVGDFVDRGLQRGNLEDVNMNRAILAAGYELWYDCRVQYACAPSSADPMREAIRNKVNK